MTDEQEEPNTNMRCCFNEMIPDVVNQLVTDMDRLVFACGECRMVWVLTRLQLSIVFTPYGRMPLIEVSQKLPGDLTVIQGGKTEH